MGRLGLGGLVGRIGLGGLVGRSGLGLGLGSVLVLGLALWTENSRLALQISICMDGK